MNARVFLNAEKSAGYALHDGDLISVFSQPGGHQGAAIIKDAIKNGATTLDCFDGKLPKFYRTFGFRE